ncbi:19889_t:CDS:2, partial [Cetraspora pellucida]
LSLFISILINAHVLLQYLLLKENTPQLKKRNKFVKQKRKFPSILNSELALDYGVKKTCISDILKQSDKWLNIDTTNKIKANRKRDHQPKWPMLDKVMRVWTESALTANMDLTQAALLTKAKTFAIALNISDFKGTGWVNGFQKWL